jgi:hypothetical protein
VTPPVRKLYTEEFRQQVAEDRRRLQKIIDAAPRPGPDDIPASASPPVEPSERLDLPDRTEAPWPDPLYVDEEVWLDDELLYRRQGCQVVGCVTALIGLIVGIVLVLANLAGSPPLAEAESPYTWSRLEDDELRPLPAVAPSAVNSATTQPTGSLAASDAVSTPAPTRKPPTSRGPVLVTGWATHWPARGAAAGQKLINAFHGHYLGHRIQACLGTACTSPIVLTTSCACGPRHGKPTVVDLPIWAFEQLAPYGAGVIWITVREVR